ncbi:HalOD1 output domain-containing protein [Halovenus sp. HT40]|uniref:HalOD1 output domain-containing protein n=1 Tax=Halovenus sp. HT40 TaxID=3126691 RepID=UPI00300EA354
MDLSQEKSATVDFVDSMSAVTFDADREWFQATYDSKRDSPSLAIVAIVASALERDPLAMPPLQSILDTDALDKLATESANGCDRVTFSYEGVEVTATSEEVFVAETAK